MGTSRLGSLLVREGLLTESDRRTVRQICGQGGGSFARGVLAMGLLDEGELAAFLAENTPWKLAQKDLFSQSHQSVWHIFDASLLEFLEVFPLKIDAGKIYVAMLDPLDLETIKHLEFFSELKVHPVIATQSQIRACLRRMIQKYNPHQSSMENFISNHAPAASRRLALIKGIPRLPAATPPLHPQPPKAAAESSPRTISSHDAHTAYAKSHLSNQPTASRSAPPLPIKPYQETEKPSPTKSLDEGLPELELPSTGENEDLADFAFEGQGDDLGVELPNSASEESTPANLSGDMAIETSDTSSLEDLSGDMAIETSDTSSLEDLTGDMPIETSDTSSLEDLTGDMPIETSDISSLEDLSGDMPIETSDISSLEDLSGDMAIETSDISSIDSSSADTSVPSEPSNLDLSDLSFDDPLEDLSTPLEPSDLSETNDIFAGEKDSDLSSPVDDSAADFDSTKALTNEISEANEAATLMTQADLDNLGNIEMLNQPHSQISSSEPDTSPDTELDFTEDLASDIPNHPEIPLETPETTIEDPDFSAIPNHPEIPLETPETTIEGLDFAMSFDQTSPDISTPATLSSDLTIENSDDLHTEKTPESSTIEEDSELTVADSPEDSELTVADSPEISDGSEGHYDSELPADLDLSAPGEPLSASDLPPQPDQLLEEVPPSEQFDAPNGDRAVSEGPPTDSDLEMDPLTMVEENPGAEDPKLTDDQDLAADSVQSTEPGHRDQRDIETEFEIQPDVVSFEGPSHDEKNPPLDPPMADLGIPGDPPLDLPAPLLPDQTDLDPLLALDLPGDPSPLTMSSINELTMNLSLISARQKAFERIQPVFQEWKFLHGQVGIMGNKGYKNICFWTSDPQTHRCHFPPKDQDKVLPLPLRDLLPPSLRGLVKGDLQDSPRLAQRALIQRTLPESTDIWLGRHGIAVNKDLLLVIITAPGVIHQESLHEAVIDLFVRLARLS